MAQARKKKAPFVHKAYVEILKREERGRRASLPYFLSFDEYVRRFPEGERYRAWLTQGGRRDDILLVQGDGPHGHLPGGYIWAYIAEPFQSRSWMIYLGDNDDGLMSKQFSSHEDALKDLEDLAGFAPFKMNELTDFGYRWE